MQNAKEEKKKRGLSFLSRRSGSPPLADLAFHRFPYSKPNLTCLFLRRFPKTEKSAILHAKKKTNLTFDHFCPRQLSKFSS